MSQTTDQIMLSNVNTAVDAYKLKLIDRDELESVILETANHFMDEHEDVPEHVDILLEKAWSTTI